MNLKDEPVKAFATIGFIRAIFIGFMILICADRTGDYLTPLKFGLAWEAILWVVTFRLYSMNRIGGFVWAFYWAFSPELFCAVALAIFYSANRLDLGFWVVCVIYVIGWIYPWFIFDRHTFSTTKTAREIKKGQLDMFPNLENTGVGGRIFVQYLALPSLVLFMGLGGAPYIVNRTVVMADYPVFFSIVAAAIAQFSLPLAYMRVGYRCMLTVIRKHNLNWT